MTSYLTYCLAVYFALSYAGANRKRVGTEATSAGIVGLMLSGVHALFGLDKCPFDIANAVVATIIAVVFITIYLARDIINK